MLRKFLNTALVTVATLATSNTFAASYNKNCAPCDYPKSYDQGYEVCPSQLMAAYNSPARIDVNCAWDVLINAAFIYWNVSEDGLSLSLSDADGPGLPINPGRVTDLNFKYKPGFKVGLGFNTPQDNWQIYAQYTWLHFTDKVSTAAPNLPLGSLYPLQAHPDNVQDGTTVIRIDRANERWKVDLDLLDCELARPYYVGTMLTFRPHAGLRAQWIDQKLDSNYRNASTLRYFNVNKKSTSWALGPRFGFDTNWILGAGFRLIGNAASGLVYTKYKINHDEQNATDPTAYSVQFNDKVSFLRPIADFQMGLGYGTYFGDNSFHFDIFATYDFHIFWNQNMFRTFTDDVSLGNNFVDLGDLYLHGLTLNVRFDF
ncbi:MAG: hypothetical protein COT84_04735 [Chlamydiae bacterium CG10_big_fil_rev_8_21_14_0_10_35_9]|nr:MAG: hypothetical protein COT84_04735 [Chlamydiae bacterium CG10_big_fil_rev_8_21_14_0_10_35_9]